ncbi:unnamed protein product [Ectocarpus sp. CCAP 1310/34]|nr:unnamed protein product [Ectocarpus sp. CCAP 1310/34]
MEREKFARVDALAAALSCPLCLEMVKDCVVTPCGHSFCRSCAGDAVTRKHCCPVCQVGVIGGEAGLIRNFMVDEVASTLRKATEDTDVAYMRLLFDTAAGGTAGADAINGKGNGDNRDHPHVGSDDARFPTGFPPKPPFSAGNSPGEAEPEQNQPLRRGVPPSPAVLSPVEEVLVRRMREAFLGYQSYYARESAAHAAEVSDLTAQLSAARREETTPRQGQAETRARRAAALQGAIQESEARFNAGMEALLRDFDAHAAAALPPPSLLPCTVTLIVASRGVRFDTQLLPTHFPENIFGKVRAHYAASGDEVRGFGSTTRLYLQPLSATRRAGTGVGAAAAGGNGDGINRAAVAAQGQVHPLSDATQTVFSQSPGGRVGAGWALVVDGPVLLKSEEVKPCFAVEFAQHQQQQQEHRVDYFSCGACKLNWLCASCAAHCHGGCGDVKPFMLNHLPNWACCYCSKKRSKLECKLAAVGRKANGAPA